MLGAYSRTLVVCLAEENVCGVCGRRDYLLRSCRICGASVCSDHILPESHNCPGLAGYRQGPEGGWFRREPKEPDSLSDMILSGRRPRQPIGFSLTETRGLVVSTLALTLAFAISTQRRWFFGFSPRLFLTLLIVVSSAFLLHELAHRFVARRFGHWAEYRMWPLGVLFSIISSFAGFVFAAPGAVFISGLGLSKRESGLISVSGPLTNVACSIAFLALMPLPGLVAMAAIGQQVNAWLALFNMIPFRPLDGQKVFAWSAGAWGVVTAASALLLIPSFL